MNRFWYGVGAGTLPWIFGHLLAFRYGMADTAFFAMPAIVRLALLAWVVVSALGSMTCWISGLLSE